MSDVSRSPAVESFPLQIVPCLRSVEWQLVGVETREGIEKKKSKKTLIFPSREVIEKHCSNFLKKQINFFLTYSLKYDWHN